MEVPCPIEIIKEQPVYLTKESTVPVIVPQRVEVLVPEYHDKVILEEVIVEHIKPVI